MDTMEAILSRRSVREYRPEQIREEKLEKIIQAGMTAPVSSNAYDSLHMTIIQNEALFQEINCAVTEVIFEMTGRRMDKSFGAPTMILISSKPAQMPGIEYANVACVLENMAIAATDLGIGSIIWGGAAVAVAQSEKLLQDLEIPQGYKPLLCISLGYPKQYDAPKEHTISRNKVI